MENPSGWNSLIESIAGASVFSVLITAIILTVIRVILAQLPDKVSRWFADLCDSLIWAAIVVFLILRPFVLQTFNIPSESMEQTLLKGDYVLVNKGIYRAYEPKAGEIIVFRGPPECIQPFQTPEKTYLIKRCIGVPGQVVEIKPGPDGKVVLHRNGVPQTETYIQLPMGSYTYNRDSHEATVDRFKIVDGIPRQYDSDGNFYEYINTDKVRGLIPITDILENERLKNAQAEPIPAGKLLMLGDNRSRSSDSRFWGLLDRNRVMGRAEIIWWPNSRWSKIR